MPYSRETSVVITAITVCCAICMARGQQGLDNISGECQKALFSLGKHHQAQSVPVNPEHMLYFLHIPRTAGRTFGVCFLKQAWAPSRRCKKSYDVLRLNTSVPGCGLLSSHDDYSVLQHLPTDAAIATQLRDPVDRVLSMYEFAVEVAARQLHPNTTQPDPNKMDTRKVWPWSILIPFMEQEVKGRAATRNHEEDTQQTSLDPYNNGFVISLADFIEHPLARELVHDGQTLQVLGVTTYSHWKLAGPVRQCLHGEPPPIQQVLLSLALKELRRFVHVGVMEMLDESVEALAATLKMPIDGPAWRNVPNTTAQSDEAADRADEEGFLEQPHSQASQQQTEPDSAYLQEAPLWAAYRWCTARARKKNAVRKHKALALLTTPDGRQLQFGHEARANLDPKLIARIRELNSMDVILHQVGKDLLLTRRKDLHAAHRLQRLPQLPAREQQTCTQPTVDSNNEAAGDESKQTTQDEL
ncbi:hypothetical protein ABBQ32_013491 [Trebouxia sp. C0010 RCD-2024]